MADLFVTQVVATSFTAGTPDLVVTQTVGLAWTVPTPKLLATQCLALIFRSVENGPLVLRNQQTLALVWRSVADEPGESAGRLWERGWGWRPWGWE